MPPQQQSFGSAGGRTSSRLRSPQPGVAPTASAWVRWLPPVLCLLVGLSVGALIAHRRARAEQVIVAVNGAVITKDELFNRLQPAAGVLAMRKMVAEELQLQFARKKGVTPTDAQVDARFEKISQRPGFEKMLMARGQDIAGLKQSLRVQLAQEGVLEQGVTVSEADVRNYYKAQSDPRNPTAIFYQPETVQVRAIETDSRDAADRAAKALADSTPFDLVAQQFSIDASKTGGGLLDPLVRGHSPLSQVPSVEQAVFILKIGQQLGPVALGNHWWIFRSEDKTPARAQPFAQVREQAREGALLAAAMTANRKRIDEEFASFIHTSNLQAFWPQYKPAISLQ